MNSSFRLVETNFLSTRNSIVLFRALLKVLGIATFLRETYYFCSWKLIFWLVKVNFFHFLGTPASERYFLSGGNVFLHKFFFRIVETDFLSWGNRFLLFNLFFFYKWKHSLKLVETNLFGADFVPVERDCPLSGNCFLLFRALFMQVETVTESSSNK